MSVSEPLHVCFVCLGNICRSPTAEGIMRALVDEAGLGDRIEIDSAGTAAWHVGRPADSRARAEAQRRGVELTSRASHFHPGDAHLHDLIVAMDHSNRLDLIDRTPETELRARIVMLRDFDPALRDDDPHDGQVPDPWSGGPDGFAAVYDMIQAACKGLLDHICTVILLEDPR